MRHPQPGWSVAFCAAVLSVSTWAPWLTTAGGRANAVGGAVGTLEPADGFGAGQAIMLLSSVLLVAGAMVSRELSAKVAAAAALGISLLIAVLIAVYYRHHFMSDVVTPDVGTADVAVGYGMFLAVAAVIGAAGCSVWALLSVLRAGPVEE